MPLILKHAHERFIYAREQAGLSLGQANKLLTEAIKTRPDPKAFWFQSYGAVRDMFKIERLEAPPEQCGDTVYSPVVMDLLADIYGVSPVWLVFGRSERSPLEITQLLPEIADRDDYEKLYTLYETQPRFKQTA